MAAIFAANVKKKRLRLAKPVLKRLNRVNKELRGIERVRQLLGLVLILLTSLALGLISADWMVRHDVVIGTLRTGPWQSALRAAADPDPYVRARLARSGGAALALSEGLRLTASIDDNGLGLKSSCHYRVSGNVTPSRYWTLRVQTKAPPVTDAVFHRDVFTSSEILRDNQGNWVIEVGTDVRAGHFLPLVAPGPFELVLTLYEPTVLGGAGAILVFCGILTFVLAAIVHISAILLMPYLASRDAGHLLMAERKTGELALLSPDLIRKLVDDPALVVAACPYNLDAGPLRVFTQPEPQEFLSIAFYQTGGTAFFAVTDRAAAKDNINILLVTAKQLEVIEAEDDPDEPVPELRLRAPSPTGFVLVRSLAQRPSEREAAIKRVTAVGALATTAHVSYAREKDDICPFRHRISPAALTLLTSGFELDQ
eukprot:gene9572-9649_t